MIEKSKKHDLRKAAGHNSVPSKQTTLLCIRVAHGLPPWKIVWVMFFNWVLIRHHIFWETGRFWEFQMKETKKVINYIKGKTLAKEKIKKRKWLKKSKNMTSGKQQDTIVYHPNKPHYYVSGLLMDYPLEKLFEWCFFKLGFNKASYILGNWAFLRISNERN